MLPLSVINKNFPRRGAKAMPTVEPKTIAEVNHNFFLTTAEAFPSCKPIVQNLHAVTVGKMMKDPAGTSEQLAALLILLFVLISLVTRNGEEKTVRKTEAGEPREKNATKPAASPRKLLVTKGIPRENPEQDDDSIPSLHEHHSCAASVDSNASISSRDHVDVDAASDDEEDIKAQEEEVPQEDTPLEKESLVTKEEGVNTLTAARSSPDIHDAPPSPSTVIPRSTSHPSFQTAMLSAAAVSLLAVTMSRSRK